MKKKYLLLLLLPFVTFSQSVFSPKSNPNSLGIAKSFGDNNSIDKPINLPFEKLHFVDVVSINKAVAELLIIKFIKYAQDGDFLKIISELNYYTSEEEKTQAIKNFSVMEKKKQFYLVEYYKAKYKDAAVIKSDKVSDSIICVFVESYDYTGEKITSKEEPIFVINIDGNWYRYIYTPTKKNNANSLGIAKSFSDNNSIDKLLNYRTNTTIKMPEISSTNRVSNKVSNFLNNQILKNNSFNNQENPQKESKKIVLTDSELATSTNSVSIYSNHCDDKSLKKDFPNLDSYSKLEMEIAEDYIRKGMLKSESGYHKSSISDYDKAIELFPFLPTAFYNRGISKFNIGDYDEATSDFSEVICLNQTYNELELPQDVVARCYYNRGNIYNLNKDSDLAVLDYNKAIEIDNVPEAYGNRGLIKYFKGKLTEACDDWNTGVKFGLKLSKEMIDSCN